LSRPSDQWSDSGLTRSESRGPTPVRAHKPRPRNEGLGGRGVGGGAGWQSRRPFLPPSPQPTPQVGPARPKDSTDPWPCRAGARRPERTGRLGLEGLGAAERGGEGAAAVGGVGPVHEGEEDGAHGPGHQHRHAQRAPCQDAGAHRRGAHRRRNARNTAQRRTAHTVMQKTRTRDTQECRRNEHGKGTDASSFGSANQWVVTGTRCMRSASFASPAPYPVRTACPASCAGLWLPYRVCGIVQVRACCIVCANVCKRVPRRVR
jgi:hypothetical protein